MIFAEISCFKKEIIKEVKLLWKQGSTAMLVALTERLYLTVL